MYLHQLSSALPVSVLHKINASHLTVQILFAHDINTHQVQVVLLPYPKVDIKASVLVSSPSCGLTSNAPSYFIATTGTAASGRSWGNSSPPEEAAARACRQKVGPQRTAGKHRADVTARWPVRRGYYVGCAMFVESEVSEDGVKSHCFYLPDNMLEPTFLRVNEVPLARCRRAMQMYDPRTWQLLEIKRVVNIYYLTRCWNSPQAKATSYSDVHLPDNKKISDPNSIFVVRIF